MLKIDVETLPCSPEEFAGHVGAYLKVMTEYGEHLKGVEADKADPDMPDDERRVAFPAPYADDLVMRAAAEGYEIVGPSLDLRKQRLFQQVSEAEQVELAKVVPPGKRRYFDLQEQAILAKQAKEWEAAGHTVTITLDPDDENVLEQQKARRATCAAVALWAAKQHHDIEDLTEETVDAWEMTPFNG